MVRKDELNLLFQGLKHEVLDANGELFQDTLQDDVNLGCILAKEFLTIRAHAHKIKEPNIYIGGMITIIAIKAGVNTDHLTEIGLNLMDLEYLQKCRILKKVNSVPPYIFQFMSRDKSERTLTLPAPELTKLDSNAKIRFEYVGEVDGEGGVAQPVEENEEDEEEVDSDEDDQDLVLPHVPEPPFKPRTDRERFLHKALQAQKKVNRFLLNLYKKLHRKLKRTPGYISSEREDESEEGEERQEQHGGQDEGQEEQGGGVGEEQQDDAP